MKLNLGGGSSVEVEPEVKETDEVVVTNKNGSTMKVAWGSVVAMTHGEALELLRRNSSLPCTVRFRQAGFGEMPEIPIRRRDA